MRVCLVLEVSFSSSIYYMLKDKPRGNSTNLTTVVEEEMEFYWDLHMEWGWKDQRSYLQAKA